MAATPEGIILGSEDKAKDVRQMCKYGENCYQKNPMHHQKFRHPSKDLVIHQKADKAEENCQKENISVDSNTNRGSKIDIEAEENVLPPSKKTKYSNVVEQSTNEKKKTAAVDTKETHGNSLPCMSEWPKSPKERLSVAFSGKLSMPDDFYEFFEFCYTLNRSSPLEALAPTCGIQLVGPFEFLLTPHERKLATEPSGKKDNGGVLPKLKTCSQNDLLCHWRYKYDPPEFQTLLASVDDSSTFHIGYFRDDPKEMPVFVASAGGIKKEETFSQGFSSHAKINPMGGNLFGAVYNYIQALILKAEPFQQTALHKIKESLHVHATIKTQEIDFPLENKTPQMKSRDKKKLTATFHGAGLVVPYNKDTEVGYREIPETTQSLKRIFENIIKAQKGDSQTAKDKAFDTLQELVTNVQFANDEGDTGMGLELGLNAFLYCSPCLDSTVKHLLSVAYGLLDREFYGTVLLAHLSRRSINEDLFKAK